MNNNFFFQHLKNIMLNAFQTETIYLKPPYDSITTIPSEIINIIFPSTLYKDERIIPSSKLPNRRLFAIKTNLSFYTIHFYLSLEENTDIIAIGPFRSDSISLDDFSKTLENVPFLSSKYTYFLNYYESLPCVSLLNIVNTVSYIINTYIPLPQTISPVFVDFTTFNNCLFDPEDIATSPRTHHQLEKMRELLRSLSNGLTNGNTQIAQREMKAFLTETALLSQKNFSDCKKELLATNIYLQTIIFNTHINLSESSKQYFTFVDKIEHAKTRDALLKIAYEMCYAYCTLFQNNMFPEYSKTINDVINYIYIHLSEPLSLSVIAEYLGKKAPYLSSDFKQETGKTITNYIQETRINQSMNYLLNTTLSVSEVALATGFDDFAYFSKIFKKHTGYSPKKYRDLYTNDDVL